jgi:LysM repeat protein
MKLLRPTGTALLFRELHVTSKKGLKINWNCKYQRKQGGLGYLPLVFCAVLCLWLAACQTLADSPQIGVAEVPTVGVDQENVDSEIPTPSPFPTRPSYSPGELVAYTVQAGDTLRSLAIHFNTTVTEILDANSIIPPDATTLPPGMSMQIPIYYKSFWGSPYQIIPNSHFINGPLQIEFDSGIFVDAQPGWLKNYTEYAAGANRSGAEIVDYVAQNFSISPQLLLATLEYQAGALSVGSLPQSVDELYPLGYQSRMHKGLYLQLVWAADRLNNGYYGWQTGQLTTQDFKDGTIEHPDPWQNAGTVAIQYYFSLLVKKTAYQYAIGPDGLAKTFVEYFGDPWAEVRPHIPGSLLQPELRLPFESGKTWAYTGGPHTGWGTGEPWAAIDFAPPSDISGCSPSGEWNTAVADGVVARTDEGVLELDLDGDGDPRTGWVIFYLHIAKTGRAPVGAVLTAGQPLGHPSCEGGTSTGTHIHIARKYNGEWIPADGIIPFDLEGWIAHSGEETYRGTLTRFSKTVVASTNAVKTSYVTAGE